VSHLSLPIQLTHDCVSYRKGRLLSGILYVQNISERRMGGKALRNIRLFESLCGKDPLKSVVVITNMWSMDDMKLGEAREQELMTEQDFFQPILREGARFARHSDTKESAHEIISSLFSHKTEKEKLAIQKEMVDDNLRLDETAAAAQLMRDFDNSIEFLRKKISEEEERMIHDTPLDRIQTEQRIKELRDKMADIEYCKETIGKVRVSISLRLIQWLKETLFEIREALRERTR
jgi:hypothetical protein